MKHIKRFKIFEDVDEDAKVPEGFEYSWNDIYESLLYLTDIGFEIDENSKKRYLSDERGREVKGSNVLISGRREYKSNVEKSKNAIYEIRLFKKKETDRLSREVSTGYYNGNKSYYLDNDIEELLKIYEEIASFCNHFDKSYHNLTIEKDGYSVWLVVSSDVTQEFITQKLDKELNDRVERIVGNQIWGPMRRLSSDNTNFTKKFRDNFFNASLGGEKLGVAIKLFNWNSVTKGVMNTNSDQLERTIEVALDDYNGMGLFDYGRFGYKAEFRDLKESDFANIKEDWQLQKLKNFVGTKAIIVKFNYDDVFKKVKEELLKEQED